MIDIPAAHVAVVRHGLGTPGPDGEDTLRAGRREAIGGDDAGVADPAGGRQLSTSGIAAGLPCRAAHHVPEWLEVHDGRIGFRVRSSMGRRNRAGFSPVMRRLHGERPFRRFLTLAPRRSRGAPPTERRCFGTI